MIVRNLRKTYTCRERSRLEISFQTRRYAREVKTRWRRWKKLAQKNRLSLVKVLEKSLELTEH